MPVDWRKLNQQLEGVKSALRQEALVKGCSQDAFKKNVDMERKKSGRELPQALAIAYRQLKNACGVKTDKRLTPAQIIARGK